MPGGAAEADELMDLFAIWREQEQLSHAPEGYVNPAAMDAWAADSIEARAAAKGAAFE